MNLRSSWDIMYDGLFYKLQLCDKYLLPYNVYDLQGINDSTIKYSNYVKLLVTFRKAGGDEDLRNPTSGDLL